MNKQQKPFVECIQCGKCIDRRTDKYAKVTAKKTPNVKYACEECMKKPVLVYWKDTNRCQKRKQYERELKERLDWKLFPKGIEVMDIRFGQRLLAIQVEATQNILNKLCVQKPVCALFKTAKTKSIQRKEKHD